MQKFLNARIFHLLLVFGILLGICFIAYANALHNAFMLDDAPIFSDIKLNNIKFLPNAFFYPTVHSDKLDSFIGSNFYYRPMAYIITLLSYLAFGKSPFGYHLFNLFLFAAMCLTVYIFIDLCFEDKILAFITSILFAIHPINVFFVDYITSGIHSVRFIGMFVSLIFYLKALEGSHKYASYAVSLFGFVVALLSHETSIVLPFYIILVGFCFKRMGLKQSILKSWPYWAMLLFYLLFRFLCTSLRSTLPAVHIDPIFYLATFSKIVFLYISKLFLPQGIVFFWNSPWMTGLNAFIWIGGILVLLSGWWLLFKSGSRGKSFFCATWLLLGFIPVFLAACPPYDKLAYGLVIEPQWLTFASVGFFLYVASIGLQLFSHWKIRTLLLSIFLFVVLVCIVRQHNEIWGDEYNYYFYWSEQIKPLPGINYAYLADFYARKKEYNQARYYFSKSFGKKSDAAIDYNLGLIDAKQGHIDDAKEKFLLSVKSDPGFYSSYNNLGVIYFNQGDYKSAKEAFVQTIKLDKYCIEARSNLGLISLIQSDYREAIHYYQDNLEIVPNDEASLWGLVQAYARLKDFDKMDKYAHLLIVHGKDPDTLATLRKLLATYKRG